MAKEKGRFIKLTMVDFLIFKTRMVLGMRESKREETVIIQGRNSPV
jgi:hypothetical protein